MAVKKEINYMRNENLKKIGVSIEYTAEQILELKKCSEDYIYFVENYCYIVTLDHGIQPFKLHEYQKKVLHSYNDNRMTIFMIGRQLGKCFCINTNIRLRNKATGDIIEMSIGDFHEKQKQLSTKNQQL